MQVSSVPSWCEIRAKEIDYSTYDMDAKQRKQLEEKIKTDQYFIDKMLSKGEKFCSYPLIIDAMRDAEERIKENKAALEGEAKA